MRFRSDKHGGYQVYAVTGTNTISFAIDFREADTRGLLGFAIERHDVDEDERYFLYGFKVFPSIYPEAAPDLAVSTHDQPVQSFVYDDFTAKPGHKYVYYFHPLKGSPKALDRDAKPIPVAVETEPSFSKHEYDVFFNRGVASSQAYQRKFGNQSPDDLEHNGEHKKAREALAWLSRDLDEAMLKFIAEARHGDTLLCCFYEFHYLPVLNALRQAEERGVKLQIIVDAKANDKAFPRKANLDAIEKAGLPHADIILREARRTAIQHNKFMVLLKGHNETPGAVWTGSTNLSMGAIHGHANVGQWVRDRDVAAKFAEYWELLSGDPGGRDGDSNVDVRKKNEDLRTSIQGIDSAPLKWSDFPKGATPIFSPREKLDVLKMYAELLDSAKDLACITLAFGVNEEFKSRLQDNGRFNALTFLLLEKEDRPAQKNGETFVRPSADNNSYEAFGSYIKDPLYQWAKETTNAAMGMNSHVNYIHSKFLLKDPLGADPIVVTGSANFSSASTRENDENMLFIRGSQRVADIYFTEFNRLFNHYYFRSVRERLGKHASGDDKASLFLSENDSWLDHYKEGSLRYKRAAVFWKMAI